MLVITRREGEEVVIGDPANPIGVVRVASVKGDRVRLALDFPREVEVHRREVADQIIAAKPSVVGKIHEAEASGASSFAVTNDHGIGDVAVGGEHVSELVVADGPGEITNVDSHSFFRSYFFQVDLANGWNRPNFY